MNPQLFEKLMDGITTYLDTLIETLAHTHTRFGNINPERYKDTLLQYGTFTGNFQIFFPNIGGTGQIR